jgi:hypothetical protein
LLLFLLLFCPCFFLLLCCSVFPSPDPPAAILSLLTESPHSPAPLRRPLPNPAGSNTAVIGIAVGVALGVAALIAVALFVYRKRKQVTAALVY